jgi:hypothetical protein
MNREPTRLLDLEGDAPSPEAAFMRTVIRAQDGERPPEGKMEELAGRLGPLLDGTNAPAPSRRRPWVAASAAALVAVGLVAVIRSSGSPARLEPFVSASAPSAKTERVSPPPPPAEPASPPVVSVDALPSVNVVDVQKAPAIAPSPAASHCDEVMLLDVADTELRSGNAERALAAVRDLEQRCAGGAFVQERERIAIEALAKLGRTDQARARARAFEERFPTSPHLRRVRQVAP